MIIGSNAIKYHFPDFPRNPKDYDIVAFDEYDKLDLTRIHKGTPNLKLEILINPVILNYYKNKGGIPSVCGIDELYTLKMSHMFWNINHEKHSWDMVWLQNKGAELIKPLFFKLYNYFNELHGANKRSDLKMSSADFFNNALKCPYDHDKLHTFLQDPPTYTKVLVGEVEVSEEKFNSLSFEDKCNLVYEEIELMSWERWPELDYRRAYGRMFKKFLISHAPLWEAIFICENFVKLSRFRRNHFEILNNAIKNEKRDNIIKRSARLIAEQAEV